MSEAQGSGLIDHTMQTTSTETSSVGRLILDPPSSKSMEVFGVESQIDDPGCYSNLAASGELPSSSAYEHVGVTPLSDITNDKGLLEFG